MVIMETITVTFEDGSKREYLKGILLKDVIEDVRKNSKFDVICANYRNQIILCNDSLVNNGELYLYDINTPQGNKIYERGLIFLFEVAVWEVLGKFTKVKIKHSIDKGIYCEIDYPLTEEVIMNIKSKMNDLVAKEIPFVKLDTSKEEALKYFKNLKRDDKIKTLTYSFSKFITLHKFNGYYNYILGDLPCDSGVLKYFDFTLLSDHGVVLRFPSNYDNGKIYKYKHHKKYFDSLSEYSQWGELLKINTIGDLNEAVIEGRTAEVVQLAETLQNFKLTSIAQDIAKRPEVKVVLLSGPSSSGKTTTAKKLSLYLKTLGLNPYHLSIDDYFLERDETPLDENGKPDFESIRAVDTKLFNSQLSKLLRGVKVTLPTFNFITGKKEYVRTLKMSDKDILVIEGLHALNEELTSDIDAKNKYKIYISPLTYLNIDNDSRIGMTDIRLLRRMIRDNRTRGYNPSHTLKSWKDVRSGEQKYVFPYQDAADNIIFNTFLVYELGVLKTYAEPLLFSIKEDDPEYQTAVRLLEMLKFVLPISNDDISDTSILREFIGGSYFERV